jgi:hypothetical protein
VGAHASADVLGDRILWAVDRLDAFFDSIFSRWSVTAPMVEWVGLSQRVFFARGVALLWELAADALLIVPLIGYDERTPSKELTLARKLLRKPQPLQIIWALCTAAIAIGGARAVAHLVRSSLFKAPLIAQAAGFSTLALLIVLFASRAALRCLEYADSRRPLALPLLLLPLALAAFAG